MSLCFRSPVVLIYKGPWRTSDLRIDKGYLRAALNLVCQFTTMKVVIVYYRYSERVYFTLFDDVYVIIIGQYLRKL